MYEDKYTVNEEKARMIYDWLCWRGGILIWVSADLSDPSYSVTTPYLDEKGNQKSKPSWKFADIPSRHITSIDDVVVSIPKEYKRFKVGTRMSSQGFSIKVTDAGSRKIKEELAKAFKETGKPAYYEFDYASEKNCIIMVDDKTIPLKEYLKEEVIGDISTKP